MTVQKPKLRFPDFSDSWEEKRLGDIFDVKSAKHNPQKENKSIKCIELEHIESETSRLIGYLENEKLGSIKNKFQKGDILFGKLRPYLKKYIIAPFDGVCSSEIWVLKGKGVANNFLFYIVQSNNFLDLANTSSGSKMPRAEWSLVSKGKTNIPSKTEQTKIANFLTAIDKKINLLKEKKNNLEAYKKGIMQQIFNQEIRFKKDDGTEFEDWEVEKFSEYIKLYRGSSPRPIHQFVTENIDGINWIKIGDTKNCDNYLIESVEEKITIKGSEKSRKVFKGELILANSMSYGKTYLLNIDGCIYDGWFVLREFEEFFNKDFLHQLLNSDFLQKQYKTLSTGGVVQNISSEIVYSTILYKPPIQEQQKIASFLSAIDEKITSVSNAIETTQAYKKGLLQQMFC
jgi:type I restriction enzyme, S subunit